MPGGTMNDEHGVYPGLLFRRVAIYKLGTKNLNVLASGREPFRLSFVAVVGEEHED
jgi:hypothetical protein